jgi:hypothetical protein
MLVALLFDIEACPSLFFMIIDVKIPTCVVWLLRTSALCITFA